MSSAPDQNQKPAPLTADQLTEIFGERFAPLSPVRWRGPVNIVREVSTKRMAAVRRLSTGDPAAEAEARRLAETRVAGMPEILQVAKGPDGILVVEEFFAGETLPECVRRGRFKAVSLGIFARQALEILAATHEAGWVHPGLTPDKFFLVQDSQFVKFSAKICGYGVLSFPAPQMFPPASYMAPAQSNGAHPDAAADLYAFAAILYYCLTGKSRKTGQLLPALPGGLPTALGPWLARALAPEPERRPPDARTMLATLEVAMESPPTPADEDRPKPQAVPTPAKKKSTGTPPSTQGTVKFQPQGAPAAHAPAKQNPPTGASPSCLANPGTPGKSPTTQKIAPPPGPPAAGTPRPSTPASHPSHPAPGKVPATAHPPSAGEKKPSSPIVVMAHPSTPSPDSHPSESSPEVPAKRPKKLVKILVWVLPFFLCVSALGGFWGYKHGWFKKRPARPASAGTTQPSKPQQSFFGKPTQAAKPATSQPTKPAAVQGALRPNDLAGLRKALKKPATVSGPVALYDEKNSAIKFSDKQKEAVVVRLKPNLIAALKPERLKTLKGKTVTVTGIVGEDKWGVFITPQKPDDVKF